MRSLNLVLSEYSFANLFLFRDIHHYQVVTVNHALFIKGMTRNHIPYLMFTSSSDRFDNNSLKELLEETGAEMFFPCPEIWFDLFEENIRLASYQDEDSDYIYERQKLAAYAGRRFDGQRNQIKQLLARHSVKVKPLASNREDGHKVLKKWRDEHTNPIELTDFFSCSEAIELLTTLQLDGRLVYVNDEPAGFTIGEWISKNCYAIHFAKATRTYHGLYPYLFQDLALSISEEQAYLNMGPDLAIASLGHAKQTYLPHDRIKKWRLKLR